MWGGKGREDRRERELLPVTLRHSSPLKTNGLRVRSRPPFHVLCKTYGESKTGLFLVLYKTLEVVVPSKTMEDKTGFGFKTASSHLVTYPSLVTRPLFNPRFLVLLSEVIPRPPEVTVSLSIIPVLTSVLTSSCPSLPLFPSEFCLYVLFPPTTPDDPVTTSEVLGRLDS